MGLATLHGGITQVNSERTAKGGDRRGEFMGVHRFQIWHTKHPVGAQRDDSEPSVGNTGLHGFCFAANDSRSGTPNIPWGLNGMILGPVAHHTGVHGFCFSAIDSRSGTPKIPLGLNGMILGPELVTWVFMGSVLLPSNPDLVLQTSRWGSTA